MAAGHASRLINHGPTVLVTSRDRARRNLMAAAWSMPVEFMPPRIAVVVDKRTWSAELIAASGLVGLCVPCAAQAYDTIFVEIDSAQADTRVFRDGRWHFDDDNAELHTLHHLGGGVFAVPSRRVRGRMLAPHGNPA